MTSKQLFLPSDHCIVAQVGTPAAIIEHPHYIQLREGIPLYVDTISPEPDYVGNVRVHLLVPPIFMGRLIGKRGRQINALCSKYYVHVNTWQAGKVFRDTSYNLPTLWATTMPSFYLIGSHKEIGMILSEFCWIVRNVIMRMSPQKRIHLKLEKDFHYDAYEKYVQDYKTRLNTVEVPISDEIKHLQDKIKRLQKEYETKNSKTTLSKLKHTTTELKQTEADLCFNTLRQQVGEYFPEDDDYTLQITRDLITTLDQETIYKLISHSDNLVIAIANIEEMRRQPGMSYADIENDAINSSLQTAYGLTEEEQLEGDVFVFHTQRATTSWLGINGLVGSDIQFLNDHSVEESIQIPVCERISRVQQFLKIAQEVGLDVQL